MSDFAVVVPSSGPTVAVDVARSHNWVITLTSATVNLCIINTPPRQRSDLFVVLKQDVTGNRVTSWSAASPSMVSIEPTTPQPTNTSGIIVHLITLDGVQWFDVGPGPATSTFLTAATLLAAIDGVTWPIADPHVIGQVWSNAGVLTVSAGP